MRPTVIHADESCIFHLNANHLKQIRNHRLKEKENAYLPER